MKPSPKPVDVSQTFGYTPSFVRAPPEKKIEAPPSRRLFVDAKNADKAHIGGFIRIGDNAQERPKNTRTERNVYSSIHKEIVTIAEGRVGR